VTATAGATHVGLKRKRNEDSYFIGKHMAAVADGMGGHVSGDVASTTVIEAIRLFDRPRSPRQLAPALSQAVYVANQAMRRRIDAEPEMAGMGTTLVAVTWSQGRFAIANVGDSRAYLLRGGKLCQLTDDHVYGRVLSSSGGVPHLDERISRFLDGRLDGRSPDLATIRARPGDRLLLCSDGLSSYVAHDAIRAAMSESERGLAVDKLIAMTLDAGAPDNVTVVVLDV
jgi:serine/threonine protein phosphatase PrpC